MNRFHPNQNINRKKTAAAKTDRPFINGAKSRERHSRYDCPLLKHARTIFKHARKIPIIRKHFQTDITEKRIGISQVKCEFLWFTVGPIRAGPYTPPPSNHHFEPANVRGTLRSVEAIGFQWRRQSSFRVKAGSSAQNAPPIHSWSQLRNCASIGKPCIFPISTTCPKQRFGS